MDALCQHFRFGGAQIERKKKINVSILFQKGVRNFDYEEGGGLGLIRQEKL